MSDQTVPNPEAPREPVHHWPGNFDLKTSCGEFTGGATHHVVSSDLADVTCPACRLATLVEDEQQSARHLRDERRRQDYLDGDDGPETPEPLPSVADWAAMSDDELGDRLADALRSAAPGERLDVIVGRPASASVEPVHFDPDRLDQLTPCGLDVPEIHGYISADPAQVTCPACAASVVDSQLPPPPGIVLTPEQREEITQAIRDEARFELSPGEVEAATERLRAAGRRTVSLEVLTDEHRNCGVELRDGHVGIVMRTDGQLVAVPEVDTMWARRYRTAPDILGQLLRQARGYADGLDGNAGAELLMPTPDVLAALAGKPVGLFTAAVEMSYGTVPPGSYVRVERARPDGSHEVVWQLLTDRWDCTDPACTAVETGQPDCRVVTVEGRGVQHVARWWPVSARIPATTEVEL